MSWLYREFNRIIIDCLNKGGRKFVIAPFGENGMLLKQILQERYNITDVLLIDNYLYKYNDTVKQLADVNTSDIEGRFFIITSPIEEIINALRENIPKGQLYIPRFTPLNESNFTYGPLSEPYHEIGMIGKFCSTAEGSCVVLNHPMSSISTHEFMYSSYHFPQIEINHQQRLRWEEFNPKKTKIGNDVWIGRNAIILNGASIGNGAVIGAGAVVTKDIPDYAVAVGNPARVIKYRFTQEQIDKLNEIRWWDWPLEKIEACYEDFKDINIFIQKHYEKNQEEQPCQRSQSS